MGLFKDFFSNVKKNNNSAFWKKGMFGVLGGATYILIPTAVQGMFKVDMSGWKGVTAGAVGATLIGMGSDHPEFAMGALAASGVHITYVYGNDTIASLLGKPIFAFDPATQMLGDDAVPPGMQEITLPDGQRVLASASGVNDFVSNLPGSQAGMNDFVSSLPAAAGGSQLRDFSNSLPGKASLEDSLDEIGWGNFN